jgi:fucose 4-O-acetylase-like acetyltransferase
VGIVPEGPMISGRDNSVDLLKVFAIALVVVGHSIQYSLPHFDSNVVYRFIYSFHMPLFMFISGYLGFSRKIKDRFLYKKFRRLVVPFLAWTVIYSVYYSWKELVSGNFNSFIEYFQDFVKSPGNGGLWFLWVLFLVFAAYSILKKAKPFYGWCLLAVFSLQAVSYVLHGADFLGVSMFCFYLPFFFAGYFTKEYNIIPRMPWYAVTLIFLLFCVLEVIWCRTTAFQGLHLRGIPFTRIVNYLAAFTAILLLFRVAGHCGGYSSKIVFWVSNNTLGIYAVHYIFLTPFVCMFGRPIGIPSISVFLVFVFTFAASCGLVFLLRANRYCRTLLLGS